MQLELLHQSAKTPKKPVSLLFIHGLYHGAWAFKGLMPFFAQQGYECYAVSLRGHGKSPGRETLKKASLLDFLEDLRQTVKRIDGPVVLLGHSLGGMLIQKHIETNAHPGAVFMCAPSAADMKAGLFTLFKAYPWTMIKVAVTGNPSHFSHNRKACKDLLFGGDSSPESERTMDQILKQPESHRILKDLFAFKASPPLQKTPVFVIGGADDTSIPHASLEAQAKFYGGTVKIYPGRSHQVFITPGWQTVAHDILEWLNGL